MIAQQIRPRQFTLEPPRRNRKYLKFLREQPCAVCSRRADLMDKVEAAHTGARGRALSQKSDDYDAIPLCGRCHRTGADSYHSYIVESNWAQHHGINLPHLRTVYLARYQERFPGDCVAECGE